MRKFLLNLFSFVGLSLAVILPIEVYRINHIVFSEQINEVYQALGKSLLKSPKCRYLLIGDSVGMQLYPCTGKYSNIVSLACNQAITLAGHYFLLHNYFEQNYNSLPDEVVLIYNPQSFRNNTDQYTFHYFLKPFYTKKYRGLYTESLWEAIKSVPFYWLSQFPFVKASSWSVDYHPAQTESYNMLSPISSDYLGLIITLLRDYDVDFRIIAPPLSDIRKQSYEQYWEGSLRDGEFEGIEQEMIDYHNSFNYWPDSLFTDQVHLLVNSIPRDYLMINDF